MKAAIKSLVGAVGEVVGAAKSVVDAGLSILGAASSGVLGVIRKALDGLSK